MKSLPWHDNDGFFKYYDPEGAKLSLGNTSRLWSTPARFNDPFDNQFDLQFEDMNDVDIEEMHKRFNEIIHLPNPLQPGSYGEMTQMLEFLRQIYVANPDLVHTPEENAYLKEGLVEGLQNLQKNAPIHNEEYRRVLADVSVFCVTESNDNMLMWSHYADDHKGAVVKFLSLAEVDSPLMTAQPIRYSNEMPRLRAPDLLVPDKIKDDILDYITLTKSKEWEYEKEWRIVGGLRDKGTTYEILPFAPKEIGEVYLGCKISEADRKEIIKITQSKYPWAKVFQAQKKATQFGLTFTLIANEII